MRAKRLVGAISAAVLVGGILISPLATLSSGAAPAPSPTLGTPASCNPGGATIPSATPTPTPTTTPTNPVASPTAQVATTLLVHFRPPKNNSVQWNVWGWENGKNGKDYFFTADDSFGCIATITFASAVSKVGVIVRQTNTWNKNGTSADRFVTTTTGTNEVWLVSDDEGIYSSVDQARAAALAAENRPLPTEPAWVKNAVIYEVNLRDYNANYYKTKTKDIFTQFIGELPRLKKLGVNTLWFMPIHPIGKLNRKGTLGSPYSVADYQDVNPEFGTKATFKTLVDSAHAQGFKVILDWVANHSAWDNKWLTGTPSRKDWYTQDAKGNVVMPPGFDWTDVADLNYNNPDMRAAMIAAMKYWVTTFGIDGYRCDYAPGVPVSFWEEASAQLNAIKPMYMLAEADSYQLLLRSAFVSDYNWPLNNQMPGMTKGNFQWQLNHVKTWYPNGTFPMNYTSNHDLNSWTDTEFNRIGDSYPAMAALSFTFPGVPMIYTGQEIGLNRKILFFEKDPVVWPTATTAAAWKWTDFYTKLTKLKANNSALASGSAGGPITDLTNDNSNVISFSRTKGNNTVIVVINTDKSYPWQPKAPQRAVISTGLPTTGTTLYQYSTGVAVKVTDKLTVSLPASGYEIYSTVAAK